MSKSQIINVPTAGQYGFQKTHGLRRLAEYGIWNAMKQRCHNPNSTGYSKYGARGITVCDRWRGSFVAFYEDMGPRPTPQHSVERTDNQKGYSPDNCFWATLVQQANNKRKTILVAGKTLTAIAAETGLSRKMIESRYYRGLSPEAIMTPTRIPTGRKKGSRLKRSVPSTPASK